MRRAIADHFLYRDDDAVLDRIISTVMFWPLLPLSLAKGRHGVIRVASILAFPPLYVVNIPLMIVVLFPALMCVTVREMWRRSR